MITSYLLSFATSLFLNYMFNLSELFFFACIATSFFNHTITSTYNGISLNVYQLSKFFKSLISHYSYLLSTISCTLLSVSIGGNPSDEGRLSNTNSLGSVVAERKVNLEELS